jgi:Glycosyltransferase WbsX
MSSTNHPAPFAIYFPQFYPTPTNDRAWGQGFTDWSLVAQANLRPSWSRRAPAAGYYDGASLDVHRRQFDQMRAYGLGGMGVYHYWFQAGQELPAFEANLLSPPCADAPPWFLIWATENWSRRWLGDSTPFLSMASSPTPSEIALHCDHLARCFAHPSYWRWQGKPVFVWYNLAHFERPEELVSQYRNELARRGFDAAFGHFVKNPFDISYSPLVDFSYMFEPRLFFGSLKAARGNRSQQALKTFKSLFGEAALGRLLIWLDRVQTRGTTYTAEQFFSYLGSDKRLKWVRDSGAHVQEVLSPGWNNLPRYGQRFTALAEIDAGRFGECVRKARAGSSLPVLINAWNEWSEGAAIEPCAYFGDRYLRALNLSPVAN